MTWLEELRAGVVTADGWDAMLEALEAIESANMGEITLHAFRGVKDAGDGTEWDDLPEWSREFWTRVGEGIRAALLEGGDADPRRARE